MSTGQNNSDRLNASVATLILAGAVAAGCIVMVSVGRAEVITRFGNPARVVREATIVDRTGRVTLVDSKSGVRVVLSGEQL